MTTKSLHDRMKTYEEATRTRLVPRMPAIIRVDGRAFHTFTRRFISPYDPGFHACMADAAQALCEEVHGARFAFLQSDEISVLVADYRTFSTQPYFGGQVQKITSIAAAVVSTAFSRALLQRGLLNVDGERWPHFDARVFNLPRAEVCNYFISRQQDATRNSIQSAGQAVFSHRRLMGLSMSEVQDLLMLEHGINWSRYSAAQKRGVAIVKVKAPPVGEEEGPRWVWSLDDEIPVFTKDRAYVDRWIDFPEDATEE